MQLPALCIQLPKTFGVDKLPNVIKRRRFQQIVATDMLIKEAHAEAKDIVDQAYADAAYVQSEAEEKKRQIIDTAYKTGLERAQLESVRGITELASMADRYMLEYESSLVDVVTESLVQIVSTFDDKTIVLDTIRKAVSTFGPSTNIDLWVSSKMSLLLDAGVKDMLLPTVLSVRVDPELQGSQCRLDNGRMILKGDVSVQVEAVRVAMQHIATSEID
jgi:flagellar biosynthesis/type III secretory pathway protein FliH